MFRCRARKRDDQGPVTEEVIQQDGLPNAGFGRSPGESAAGIPALSLMPPGDRVLTVEMTTSPLSPAIGDGLGAEGRVVRIGRNICIVSAEIYTELADGPVVRHVATMSGTVIRAPTIRRG